MTKILSPARHMVKYIAESDLTFLVELKEVIPSSYEFRFRTGDMHLVEPVEMIVGHYVVLGIAHDINDFWTRAFPLQLATKEGAVEVGFKQTRMWHIVDLVNGIFVVNPRKELALKRFCSGVSSIRTVV